MAYLWNRGISPKTYNSVLDILRCVFRLMNKDSNPFDGFKKKVCHTEERVAFTVEQLQQIWDTLNSPDYHMLHLPADGSQETHCLEFCSDSANLKIYGLLT